MLERMRHTYTLLTTCPHTVSEAVSRLFHPESSPEWRHNLAPLRTPINPTEPENRCLCTVVFVSLCPNPKGYSTVVLYDSEKTSNISAKQLLISGRVAEKSRPYRTTNSENVRLHHSGVLYSMSAGLQLSPRQLSSCQPRKSRSHKSG